jgi:adenine-specific DNA-methyltransferase
MTELIWDGKYKDGKKQGPVRIALPFQTIETVNESAQDRRRNLELFASGRDTEWRNRLIWGDKKYVLPSLLPDFAGKVNLIYVDPPFDTGADFSFLATIPENPNSPEEEATVFTKAPSILEQKAYRDTWGRGLDSYLEWFYETMQLLYELLSDTGSIYVHLDWHVGHYAKIVLDEVFGEAHFQNNIVWKRGPGKSHPKSYGHNADYILFYTKSENYTWNKQFQELSEEYLKTFKEDKSGKYVTSPLHSGKPAKNVPTWRGVRPPHGRGWAYKLETLEKLDKEGSIEWSSEGIPRLKRYLDDIAGAVVQEIWTEIKPVLGKSGDYVYATQKPEELLERIIDASSKEGELVLDCFAGSGTTPAVAEKLNRHWIACDLGRFAVHTTRKRLLGIPGVKPFAVQNLGKYERQAWQVAEFPANGKDHLEEQRKRESSYRKFILDLYHATPMTGHAWLHGTKSGRLVHVAAVDAPVTQADVKAIARETWKAIASGKDSPTKAAVDILGWEFALEVNELAKNVAAESRVDVSFKKIPREVLDKKAIEQGDVKFFELGALSVNVKQKARDVILKLTDFVIPTDDIPEEARKAIKHWSQLVDYWAVDWDYKNDTFHNQWQAYRTRKEPKIELETKYEYKEPGKHQIVVKVIDILGNDTTKTLEVTVK